jgi:hypothetical protein
MKKLTSAQLFSCAKEGAQDQDQARAREVGHSQGARACGKTRGKNGAAICGEAFNDAPSYRVAETSFG